MGAIDKGELPQTETEDSSEKFNKSDHYLHKPELRKTISEKWPEIKQEQIDDAATPAESGNPDKLESWEAAQRVTRMSYLSANPSTMSVLQMEVYEECFGVNASPSSNESFMDSVAPTPGGMISHGYFGGTMNGYNIEEAVKLSFSGETARECVDSLNDRTQRAGLATVIAQVTEPTGRGEDYMSEMRNRTIQRQLLEPGKTPGEEVTTWGLRLVKLAKEVPELTASVEDPELRSLIAIREGVKVNLLSYWNRLWAKYSGAILTQTDNGPVFKNPEDPEVQKAIGELLKVRLHPQTQILFKYLSPSGYLNKNK